MNEENIIIKIGSGLKITGKGLKVEITDEGYESIKNLTVEEVIDKFQLADTE